MRPDSRRDFNKKYAELASDLSAPVGPFTGYSNSVNFQSNSKVPVHRWFYFKEGFSHNLVEDILKDFEVNRGKTVLDPFAGSGTTLLSCQWHRVKSIGIDINPFFTFAQNIKINWPNYHVRSIDAALEKVVTSRSHTKAQVPHLSSFFELFTRDALDTLLRMKARVAETSDDLTRGLMMFALASIIEEVSLARKHGKSLKRSKATGAANPLTAFRLKMKSIKEDIAFLQHSGVGQTEPAIFNADIRHFSSPTLGKADFALFSPPYLNTFDYTEVYKLELWFLDFVRNYEDFRNLRSVTLRSHNLYDWPKSEIWQNDFLDYVFQLLVNRRRFLWNRIIPEMVRGYFDDMYLALRNIYSMLSPGANCVLVTGNSAYGGIPIPSDVILAKIAQDVGFTPMEIRVARMLGTSSQQMRAIKKNHQAGYLRESLVVLQK